MLFFLCILTIGIQNTVVTYSKYDINQIYLIRLVVMKRPGFISPKYGTPTNAISNA